VVAAAEAAAAARGPRLEHQRDPHPTERPKDGRYIVAMPLTRPLDARHTITGGLNVSVSR